MIRNKDGWKRRLAVQLSRTRLVASEELLLERLVLVWALRDTGAYLNKQRSHMRCCGIPAIGLSHIGTLPERCELSGMRLGCAR